MRRLVVLLGLIWFSGAAAAQEAVFAGPRHALVIGVGAYRNVAPLPSPEQDAEDVAERLRQLDFAVTLTHNPGRVELDGALRTFTKTLPRGALAFVYYSGHGVEAGGKNLLLPVDFPHPNRFADLDEAAAPYYMGREAVVLDDMLDLLANAKPKNLIVVLDACRNNPLQPDEGKGVAKKELGGQAGLGAISPRAQTYVMYAAGARQKAVDRLSSSDTARNSLFTRHLLAEIAKPGLPLDRAFKNAAAKVEREAQEKGGGHRQRPAIYTDVYDDIVLAGVLVPPPPLVRGPRVVDDRWSGIAAGSSYMLRVLDNDAAAAGGGLRVASVGGVSRGRAEVSGDGQSVTYTAPTDGSGGEVSFSYRVRESGGGEAEGRVTLSLNAPLKPEPPRSNVIPVVGVFPQVKSVFKDCSDCPEMVVVPAGSFTMGSPENEPGRGENEDPQHRVTIPSDFAVGRYEVTQAEWRSVMGSDPSRFKGYRLPVEGMTWNDTQEFIKRLSAKTKQPYRLLTEAEWEYAARAGTTTAFWWGTNGDNGCGYANGRDLTAKDKISYLTKVANCRDGYAETSPVGSFAANGFSLHDMHGNVYEWVEDCYVDNYRGAPTDGSAVSGSIPCWRVNRGGSSYPPPIYMRSANRNSGAPDYQYTGIGFRVARTLP